MTDGSPGPVPGLHLTHRVILAIGGLASVVPLLAWVYDRGSFHAWFWMVAAPGMGALAAVGLAAARWRPGGELHVLLRAALVAGLVGTLGYDLFRVPFVVLGGLQLFAPIESYGILLADASASSGLTDAAGWAYHVSNGVGFAVTYAALAAGRRVAWGVAWAAVLETATLVSPFAVDYALAGKYGVIVIAYAAHVPYGLALGLVLQRPRATFDAMSGLGHHPSLVLLVATAAGLVWWLSPWAADRADAVADSTDVAIVEGRFVPKFVRVGVAGCFLIENLDADAHVLDSAPGAPLIRPGQRVEVCPTHRGVARWHVTGEPWDGGFVIVDDQRTDSS